MLAACKELVLPGWQGCYEGTHGAVAQCPGHRFGLAGKVSQLLCQAQALTQLLVKPATEARVW